MVRRAGIPLVAVLVIVVGGGFLLMLSLLITFGCWKKRQKVLKDVQVMDDMLQGPPSDVTPPEGIPLSDIKLQSILGMGEFGKVYKGMYRGEVVAVKMIDHDVSGLRQNGELLEAMLSKNVDHHNVVKTYGHHSAHMSNIEEALSIPHAPRQRPTLSDLDVFSYMAMNLQGNGTDQAAYRTLIVMEFCDKGSLYNAIKDGFFFQGKDKGSPKYASILLTALDIAHALSYLHDRRIIHGDLKTQNVLLMSDSTDERGFYCKVGDFGLSRVDTKNSEIETFTCGTVRYMPPELLKDGLLTPSVDVYSFGMLLWELISGVKPYRRLRNKDIIVEVVDGQRPLVPLHCPADITSLIQDCWHGSYVLRPTFRQVTDRLRSLRATYVPSSSCQDTEVPIDKKMRGKGLDMGTCDGQQSGMTIEVQNSVAESPDIQVLATSQKGWRGIEPTCSAGGEHNLIGPMPLWERYVMERGDTLMQSASLELIREATGTIPSVKSCPDSKAKHSDEQGLQVIAEAALNKTMELQRGAKASVLVTASKTKQQHSALAVGVGTDVVSHPVYRQSHETSVQYFLSESAVLLGLQSNNCKDIEEPMSWSVSSRWSHHSENSKLSDDRSSQNTLRPGVLDRTRGQWEIDLVKANSMHEVTSRQIDHRMIDNELGVKWGYYDYI